MPARWAGSAHMLPTPGKQPPHWWKNDMTACLRAGCVGDLSLWQANQKITEHSYADWILCHSFAIGVTAKISLLTL